MLITSYRCQFIFDKHFFMLNHLLAYMTKKVFESETISKKSCIMGLV
jgi:hypothetical protein